MRNEIPRAYFNHECNIYILLMLETKIFEGAAVVSARLIRYVELVSVLVGRIFWLRSLCWANCIARLGSAIFIFAISA